MLFDQAVSVIKKRGVPAKTIDDKAGNHRGIRLVDDRLRAHDLSDHPPAIYIGGQNDGHVSRARKAHVGDVTRAQIDLCRAARAFHENEIVV